jgi:hypothetical protein
MVAKRNLEFFVGCLYMLEFERIGAYRDVLFTFSARWGRLLPSFATIARELLW